MIARFGEFQLDSDQALLTRAGATIRIEKMPLDLLVLLVTRYPNLVRREEITAALWGETFVDAEHGINTAIKKIRTVLEDDPTAPRYIETVPRQGYRFKEPVTVQLLTVQVAPRERRRTRLVWAVAGAIAIVASWIAVQAWSGSRQSMPILRWRPLTKEIHTFSRLASDGHKVYWTEVNDTGCHPYAVPVEGGESTPVRMPFRSAEVLDASSDGHVLIVPRENCPDSNIQGPLWEVMPESGDTRRVGDLFVHDAVFSPDGRRIAVAKANQISIVNRDGSGGQQLATLPAMAWTMHWSPDAGWLRFAMFESNQSRFRLWEASTDGRVVRPLLSDWKDSSEKLGGVWVNADDFLFSATRRGSMDLWRLRPARWTFGSARIEQVTAGPLDFEGPTLMPGGAELAVLGTHRQGELQQYDAASHQFVPYIKGLSGHMADFSRDGQWMTYVSYPDGQLWRSRVNGSEALQLTHEPMRVGLPRFSPDGKRIAFTAEVPGELLRVMWIPADGGTPQLALQEPHGFGEVAPTWSADGTRLLFRGDLPGQEAYFKNDVLQIVELATRKVSTVPGSAKKFNQRWSPDGKWIVATPVDQKSLELFDVAGGHWTVLASVAADYPSWSPDSKHVYFVSGTSILRASLQGKQVETVASLDKVNRAMDETWGPWCGLTPAGAPLILRSADLQQIYALSLH